jgi:phospholipid-binding lipoprotein MlaA
VNSLLYESADSYAQARLLYLQNRRFQLDKGKGSAAGQDSAEDGFIDPYADAPSDDGFIDPYEDPYAQ